MAVAPTSSPTTAVAAAGDSESKKVGSNEQMELDKVDGSEIRKQEEDPKSKKEDQGKSAEVRAVGGRIGDPQNAKTCHQCRQKIMALAVGCKNMKKDKLCPMKYCHKCLRNRYGEKAEEMEALDDWKCPKCRGICNCSICMKKKGLRPTGMLVHAAKATGFSSVSELLDAKGSEACRELIVKKKIVASAERTVSLQKIRKDSFFDETSGTIVNFQTSPLLGENAEFATIDSSTRDTEHGVVGSPILVNHQEVAENQEKMDGDNCVDPAKVMIEIQKRKAKIKRRKLEASLNNHAADIVLPPGTLLTSVSEIDLCPEDVGYALQFLEFCSTFGEVLDIRKGQPESVLRDIMSERGRRKGKYSSAVQFLIQLLSFILKGEDGSPSLSLDSDKDSWMNPLKKCISESECVLEGIPKDCFDKGYDGYEMLEPSQKLKLVAFLCDEALCTIELRNWMEDQNAKFVEKLKEAREILNAAKEKDRMVKLKLQDELGKEVTINNREVAEEAKTKNGEVVKEVITKDGDLGVVNEVATNNGDLGVGTEVVTNNGDLLANTNHNCIVSEARADAEQACQQDPVVSEVQAEVEQARVDLLKAIDALPKRKQRSDALRIQPVLLDEKGRVYWRLKCCSDLGLLLQDIGDPTHQAVSSEKWFSYDAEETNVIEKHISSLRVKRRRLARLDDPLLRVISSDSDLEADSSSNDDESTPAPAISSNYHNSKPAPPISFNDDQSTPAPAVNNN